MVQLAVFFRGINMEFSVTEKLAALIPMKGTLQVQLVWRSQEGTANPNRETSWTGDRWSAKYSREEQ
jgi:hypothetical protein